MDDLLELLMRVPRQTPMEAERTWRNEPGLYAIFVDEAAALPEPYCNLLRQRRTSLVYIGLAGCLLKRAIKQDLRHKQPASFFRSIGAVLGYTPPAGSLPADGCNYRFGADHTREIIAWIDTHLLAAALPMSPSDLAGAEKRIIRAAAPLLNDKHNRSALKELKAVRSRCRMIARNATGVA